VAFEDNCFQTMHTTKDGLILSIAQIFSRDSNFCRYKVYVELWISMGLSGEELSNDSE